MDRFSHVTTLTDMMEESFLFVVFMKFFSEPKYAIIIHKG